MNGFKDNSNLEELFIGENPSPKSERPQFKNNEIVWNNNVIDDHRGYTYTGCTQISVMSELLTRIKASHDGVEIHVSPSTCALVYRNNINDSLLMWNLKLVCEEDEIFQILSDIYNGAFDLKNKKFWINSNEGIDIVINKSVKKGYSYIVSGREIVGYCEHIEC